MATALRFHPPMALIDPTLTSGLASPALTWSVQPHVTAVTGPAYAVAIF